jgi:hypothetical protein
VVEEPQVIVVQYRLQVVQELVVVLYLVVQEEVEEVVPIRIVSLAVQVVEEEILAVAEVVEAVAKHLQI